MSPVKIVITSVVSSIPDFILAWVLLQIWLYPLKNSSRGVHWALTLMLMDFFIIHSAGIMRGVVQMDIERWKKVPLLLFLCSVYSVFVYMFGSWAATQGFWLLCLNRAIPVLTGRVPKEGAAPTQADYDIATSGVLLIFAVFVGAFMWFPALGVTPEVKQKLGFSSGGIWNDQPYRIMATGVIYYTTYAFIKLGPICDLWQMYKVVNKYEKRNVS